MTFRTKLLFISSFTVAGAVALVTGAVSISTRRAFERIDTERREALLTQFRAELDAQSAEIARRLDLIAKSPGVQQIAAGAAEYDRAQTEAAAASLDFLDVVQPDLTIISSAHWPAKFGYKNDWQIAPDDWRSADVFLARIPTEDGSAVGLITVRPVSGGRALASGGRRLTPELLKSLGIAPGMRALLWVPPGEIIDAQGRVNDPHKLDALVQEVRAKNGQATGVVQWTPDRASSEGFVAFPLTRAGMLAGVLLAGTSLGQQLALERSILWTGVVVAASGIAIGILLGWWTTERITKPVERLAAGARAVAGGDLSARVEVLSRDEIGDLARAFNRMTEQLLEQRERAIQAERVAAWRELARRLAHELKNPLFPLQITIENLQRARGSADFDEVFDESTATLLAELDNLKTIIGRFSDFAKMPTPQFETVDVNEVVRSVMKLCDARFQANGRPRIEPVLELEGEGIRISADPEQLRRAFGNLVLNAMDAMPEGGTLHIRTARHDGGARVEISDSGQGLTEEECGRLFTPYYTTKQHGTGLGLAIVQSVVSDHQGKIAVVSQPGRGATFVIDLPESHIQEAAS
ncbi:MAG TPA: ATP-binding protein [Bryobacteraceae bacterium]|nr:ATP-binding protein [Bryobacteraceae bacterium]